MDAVQRKIWSAIFLYDLSVENGYLVSTTERLCSKKLESNHVRNIWRKCQDEYRFTQKPMAQQHNVTGSHSELIECPHRNVKKCGCRFRGNQSQFSRVIVRQGALSIVVALCCKAWFCFLGCDR